MGYLRNRIKAFGFAFNGLALFFRESPHARIHLLAVVLVSLSAWYFELSKVEWLIIILCYALVLGLEALNSAIEYVVDLASPEYHNLARKAKDVAAAAVLIAALASFVITLIIFIPKL